MLLFLAVLGPAVLIVRGMKDARAHWIEVIAFFAGIVGIPLGAFASHCWIALLFLARIDDNAPYHSMNASTRPWRVWRTAVRSIFEMTSTRPLGAEHGFVRRRSPLSR